jgi:hypothetical protein
MENQPVAKGQLLGIEHQSIRILDGRIAGNTPALMADDPATMFTRRLSVVLVAVIPTVCGIG